MPYKFFEVRGSESRILEAMEVPCILVDDTSFELPERHRMVQVRGPDVARPNGLVAIVYNAIYSALQLRETPRYHIGLPPPPGISFPNSSG